MDIKTFKQVAPILFKHRIVPYLHGNRGVSKTEVARQLAKELGFDGIVAMEVGANADSSDIVGLLRFDDEGNHYHTRPSFMPKEGRYLIFFDEFNRAPSDVYQALYPFFVEGRIGQYTIPEGCRIMVAGNYDSADFTTTKMRDKAMKSRFCHIDYRPTAEEWFKYLVDSTGGSDEAKEMVEFLRLNPEHIEEFSASPPDLFPKPDRRAWHKKVLPLMGESFVSESARFEVYQGVVGTIAATQFMSWNKVKEEQVPASKVFDEYSLVSGRVRYLASATEGRRFDILANTVDDVLGELDKEGDFMDSDVRLENLRSFILDLPVELILKIVTKVSGGGVRVHNRVKNEILENPSFAEKIGLKMKNGDSVKLEEKEA